EGRSCRGSCPCRPEVDARQAAARGGPSVRRIEVTYSTMGQSNPAHVAERKDYAWRGDPAKSEAARTARRPRPVPESLRGNPSRRREEKEKRYAEFCEHRKNG